MHLTKEQLESVRKGEPLRLSDNGTELVVLRADLFSGTNGTGAGMTVAGWENWFAKLESCRLLKDGWNGYTAPAPHEKAIENAKLFLQVMQLEEIEPTRVAPSAMGGIAITRRVEGRKVFVEFYNDGRVYSLFSDKASEMKVNPLEASSIAFRALISNMRDYLNVGCAA